ASSARRSSGSKFTDRHPKSSNTGAVSLRVCRRNTPPSSTAKSPATTSGTWCTSISIMRKVSIRSSADDDGAVVVDTRPRRNALRGDFLDRLVGFRELQRDQQFDHGPGRIDLAFAARPPAEFRAAGMPMVVVVQAFAAGQQGDKPHVGRRVVEVAIAE